MSRNSKAAVVNGSASTAGVLLCADDFAMTNGVSRAIVELAELGRISATSAMTTSAHWPAHATWLARIRGRVSAGLHLNLTLGSPLGTMPAFAPGRRFPSLGKVTFLTVSGRIDRKELAAEITRQLASFEAELGFPPDHIDGHQHVHALPIIRMVLLEVLGRRYPLKSTRPLLRDPTDRLDRILIRGAGRSKALTLGGLTLGFGAKARAAGFETNRGFGGVTNFAESRAPSDFAAASRAIGPRHMVMCHPGFVDDELKKLDPITGRRQQEFDYLAGSGFPLPLWHPRRSVAGDPVAWNLAWTGSP